MMTNSRDWITWIPIKSVGLFGCNCNLPRLEFCKVQYAFLESCICYNCWFFMWLFAACTDWVTWKCCFKMLLLLARQDRLGSQKCINCTIWLLYSIHFCRRLFAQKETWLYVKHWNKSNDNVHKICWMFRSFNSMTKFLCVMVYSLSATYGSVIE